MSPKGSSTEEAAPATRSFPPDAKAIAGYLHPRYSTSLAEFGQPRLLPKSGAWILVRPIRGCDKSDAMAGDRHLFCADWSALADDLDGIDDLVSVTAVTDPFGQVHPDYLRNCFPDVMRPYKEHFVIDLQSPTPSPHHRAKVRRAFRSLETSVNWSPIALLDEWEALYAELRTRHGLTGIRAFSRTAFREQLATPGCVAVSALLNGRCVAMNLWYLIGDVGYSHLTALNADGYSLSATYALVQTAIDTFSKEGLRWLNLGSSAGALPFDQDGLGWFKRGWATGTRTSYLCGRVIDRDAYVGLVGTEFTGLDYFPAYRRGEFV